MKKYGRPTKIHPFTRRLKQLLTKDRSKALFLTDEELVEQVNSSLKDKDRICLRTFRMWKKAGENNEKSPDFFPLIKKALFEEKMRLFNKLQNDARNWTRWAWIIERKFDDWNIRKKNAALSREKIENDFVFNVTTIGDQECG